LNKNARKRNPLVTPKVDRNEEGSHEEDTTTPRRLGNEINTAKF
jgi:hypothetical protein